LEKSTAAVKRDKNNEERRLGDKPDGVRLKYREETSLSFMLAVWKTND
jgi:hypothetical protein